jgi:hypothetical protein
MLVCQVNSYPIEKPRPRAGLFVFKGLFYLAGDFAGVWAFGGTLSRATAALGLSHGRDLSEVIRPALSGRHTTLTSTLDRSGQNGLAESFSLCEGISYQDVRLSNA